MARIAIPPGTPDFSPGPVRTPVPVENGQILFKGTQPWQKYFEQAWNVILSLVARPVLLSGLAANRPLATLYPENTRYWSTDTHHESIVIYATPGDPSTASWQVMF